ncbi:Sec7-domain-containing protein [Morchella conica CCBAS932]|uniref:Sec7-domain-containing protein n=1 Tax=Morchella conica CCBAS932 TaxID=1392247 RepID=A0A3N4KY27_9PEZI|nr:Sec7-domain-containing protein [Morchella conica CCBAS932]
MRESSKNAPTTSSARVTSASLTTNNSAGQPSLSSMVFVVQALESIGASKEGKRRKSLGESVQRALTAIRDAAPQLPPDPAVVFEPLQIACTVQNTAVVTTALDCIGKLISYSYFSILPPAPPAEPERGNEKMPAPETPLIEKAIETICDCFQGDTTPDMVQLQIIKALLAAVLNDKVIVHGAGLLKAVRQTYNIFLLSRNSPNQMTAQGTLTQMVHTVFERVKIRIAMKEANLAASANSGNESPAAPNRPSSIDGDSVVGGSEVLSSAGGEKVPEKITLQSFENRKSFDDERIADNAPTTVTRSSSHRNAQPSGSTSVEEDEDEVFTKDAFLVFRAMCKLSIKTLPAEQVADLKSHGMRSKLLSLHLLHTILKSHMIVFVSPLSTIRSSSSAEATGFVHAIKQYLCLSLSRNAASAVGLVFEVCCEIFWLLVGSMRVMLKKEIEVFLKEIYLNILDNRHSSVQQKQYLLSVLERICSDPRALVEIYLNYDCDRTALDNMFQRLIEHLSRITTTQVSITELQQQQYGEERKKNENNKHHGFSLPPSLSTANIAATPASTLDPTFPVEYTLKRQSLECLIAVLQSLVTWSQKGFVDVLQENAGRESQDGRDSMDNTYISPRLSTVGTPIIGTPYPELERSVSSVDVNEMVDDPSQLEKAKQRKTALVEAIKKFNFKPKRGIKALVEGGFIESETPANIAEFLLKNNNSLDKKVIGEYLGEGDPENIAAMHAFVDQMDFVRMRFVDALRRFLQSFRLPGEAQKIDRFMLKFAERYISGNPNAFANADTAYVLAYSVILLNTDQHSAKLKGRARMTPDEFVKNNRGINDNADLPPEYLLAIYEEIRNNEIVLEGEKEREAARGAAIIESGGGIVEGIGRVLANAGRDLEREAYVHASEEMANKTEQLFKTLLKAQRKNGSRPQLSKYIAASSSKHVGPMFEVTWMSILSGLSGAAQDSNETEMIKLCMEGFKLAIRVACFFDLETPRIAFVTALAKFTHLNNLSEMKSKNVEALKVLLDVAQTEGNLLKTSWRDVLTCISQLERFQLISSGVDEGSVPDVTKGRIIHPDANSDARSRSSMQSQRPMRSRPRTQTNTHYVAEVAEESRSREVIIAVDKIFANTSKLTGEAIVDFVRALSEVSWQEIQSSGQSEHPRMFSLQKLVEISYYNMGRIRVEWSNLWNILGEHFNQVGCHTNTSVVFFALDSLRQLSMRFLEIEELPHFKFQKDFLKPFQHVMANNAVVPVKDMVLRCLSQMLQARGDKIKSGWRTMFGTFTYAAKENYDQIVNLAFDSVRKIYSTRFGVVVSQGGFTDMIVCLTEFAKNQRFQKISLQAIETLKGTVPDMLSCPECPLSQTKKPAALGDELNPAMIRTVKEDPMIKFWFPVLFSFHDILMTGEDLEARTRALGYLFDILVKYGGDFPTDFWDTICHELLFPIFMVLKSRSEMAHFSTQEAVGMWLSTTMIQALRNLIALFTHYFDLLERMLDGFLDLLVTCICQENDTIARIGSSCLQQLILQSVKKLRPEHWTKIVSAFVQLFEITTADQLFSAATQGSSARSVSGANQSPPNEPKGAFNDAVMEEDADGENALKINGLSTPMLGDDSSDTSPEGRNAQNIDLEDYRPQQMTQQPVVTAARRRFFNKIITKCVLQLLMIETVSELFSNDAVYSEIPSTELLRLMGVLKKSFTFARRFNSDKELRMKLWREGFMKQPPNLLKQESGSASTYVSILLRMYHDDQRERRESRGAIESALIPLCVDILRSYTILDEETQQRNVIAWRPVVVDVMEGYTNFPERDFDRHIDTFYPLAVEMLNREPGPDVRIALQNLLRRVGEVKRMGIMGRGRVRDRRMSDMSGMNVRRTP